MSIRTKNIRYVLSLLTDDHCVIIYNIFKKQVVIDKKMQFKQEIEQTYMLNKDCQYAAKKNALNLKEGKSVVI